MKVIEEPTKPKRKRFAKNKKKAWKKKIDLVDIEESLIQSRRNERINDALGERPFEDLFTLDLSTSNVKGAQIKKKKLKAQNTTQSKSKKKDEKEIPLPKCHQFLNGLIGAKAISKKGGIMKQNEMKVLKYAKKLSRNTPKAQIQRARNQQQRKEALKMKKAPKSIAEFKGDLWNENKKEKMIQKYGEVGETYMKNALKFHEEQTKQAKLKTPSVRFQKPSALPSVIPPKGCESYNPSYEHHQKGLRRALKDLQKEAAQKAKEQRIVQRIFSSKDGRVTEEQKKKEMVEGLPFPFSSDALAAEGALVADRQDDEEAAATFTGPTISYKKNTKTRKKELKRKIKENRRLQKKNKLKTDRQVDELTKIKKEIEQKEKVLKNRRKKKKKIMKQNKFKTKRLAREKFVREETRVALGTELKGSLRKIHPMRNTAKSIVKHFERRNLIAPHSQKPVKIKKRRVKMIKKKSHQKEMNNFMQAVKDFV